MRCWCGSYFQWLIILVSAFILLHLFNFPGTSLHENSKDFFLAVYLSWPIYKLCMVHSPCVVFWSLIFRWGKLSLTLKWFFLWYVGTSATMTSLETSHHFPLLQCWYQCNISLFGFELPFNSLNKDLCFLVKRLCSR